MLKHGQLLFALVALAVNAVVPPTTGKFFYTDFDMGRSRGMHSMNVIKSDKSQVFTTMVSTNEYYMGLYQTSCDTCQSTVKYSLDGNAYQVSTPEPIVQKTNMFNGQQMTHIDYSGDLVHDKFKVYFQQYNRSAEFESIFLGVTQETPSISQIWNGFIGIAPYTANVTNQNYNFMYQLKQNGIIDNLVASFYIKAAQGNSSSIKFGSYDETGIAPGATLEMFATANKGTWNLNARNFKANNHDLSAGRTRQVSFDMMLPYIYIPDHDFLQLAEALSQFDLAVSCLYTSNYCKFFHPCSEVTDKTWFLEFDVFDNNRSLSYTFPESSNLLITGSEFGDSDNTCYLSIFRSMLTDQQDTWFMGNSIMNFMYMVYDMSPLDQGLDFIQVGMAPINPMNIIGEEHYDTNSTNYNPENTTDDQSKTDNTTIPVIVPTNATNDTNSTVPSDVTPIAPVGPVIVKPTEKPDTNGNSWISRNRMWIIVGGIGLLLLVIMIMIYCMKKGDKDPYKEKAYSSISPDGQRSSLGIQ